MRERASGRGEESVMFVKGGGEDRGGGGARAGRAAEAEEMPPLLLPRHRRPHLCSDWAEVD